MAGSRWQHRRAVVCANGSVRRVATPVYPFSVSRPYSAGERGVGGGVSRGVQGVSDNTTWPFEEATAINARYVADEGLVVGRHSWNRHHTFIADVGVRLGYPRFSNAFDEL